VIGFLLSIGLTLIAYFSVVDHLFNTAALNATIVILSIVQVIIQLVFFLHLGEETKPRWNLLVFLFMLLVLAILVWGTLWIMYNLDYRMMPTMNMNEQVHQ